MHSYRKHDQSISCEYSYLKWSIKNLSIYLSFRRSKIDTLESAGTYHHFTTVQQTLSYLPKPYPEHLYRRHKNFKLSNSDWLMLKEVILEVRFKR